MLKMNNENSTVELQVIKIKNKINEYEKKNLANKNNYFPIVQTI